MKHINLWFIALLVITGLQLSACATASSEEEIDTKPALLESIEGSDLHRVILTEQAAERIGLQMGPVREEEVERKRTVGGIVVLPLAAPDSYTDSSSINVWIRVPLNGSEFSEVDQDQSAIVLPLGEVESTNGLTAHTVDETNGALYYALDATNHNLTLGQRVQVELSLLNGGSRQVVPYDSVIYGEHGETWVFVTSEPLVFVREPIVIDYIVSNMAVLSEGPDVGTEIVTVGSEELYGSEFEFAEE